jgi:hypothetical protein
MWVIDIVLDPAYMDEKMPKRLVREIKVITGRIMETCCGPTSVTVGQLIDTLNGIECNLVILIIVASRRKRKNPKH